MAAGEVVGKPTYCDLYRKRGDTKEFVIKIFADDAKTTQEDILGWTGLLTITTEANPTDASTQIYQASGTPDPASPRTSETQGRMIFSFSTFDAQSPQLAPGKYYYDVQVTDGAALDCTVLEGKFEIGQDRTK